MRRSPKHWIFSQDSPPLVNNHQRITSSGSTYDDIADSSVFASVLTTSSPSSFTCRYFHSIPNCCHFNFSPPPFPAKQVRPPAVSCSNHLPLIDYIPLILRLLANSLHRYRIFLVTFIKYGNSNSLRAVCVFVGKPSLTRGSDYTIRPTLKGLSEKNINRNGKAKGEKILTEASYLDETEVGYSLLFWFVMVNLRATVRETNSRQVGIANRG